MAAVELHAERRAAGGPNSPSSPLVSGRFSRSPSQQSWLDLNERKVDGQAITMGLASEAEQAHSDLLLLLDLPNRRREEVDEVGLRGGGEPSLSKLGEKET